MPIYEYEPIDPRDCCEKCLGGFEIIQGINEKPLFVCPYCGRKVKKVISWCHSAVVEASDEHVKVEGKIREYEKARMWSHAAELADKHSEKVKDRDMKIRALDNYKNAGYDPSLLEKHVKT